MTTETKPKFQFGDRVRVVRKNEADPTSLDIGDEVTIADINSDGTIYYPSEVGGGGFDESEVELISRASSSESETAEQTKQERRVEMKDEYVVSTESALERRMVLAALIEAGFKWHNGEEGCETAEGIEKKYAFKDYPGLLVEVRFRSMCGNCCESSDTIQDLFRAIANYQQPIKIKLNSSYEAEVTKSGVKVGCQEFTFEAVEELAAAVAKMKGGQS